MPFPALDRIASIILAGGQGKRLFPLTLKRCKPDVCFGGRYRLIDIPISNALNAKIQRIFVISQYFASSLQQHITETYQLDPFSSTQIQMLCPEETRERKTLFRGTADAIRQNLEHFEKADVDYFLILSGDQLYNIDFTHLVNYAKKQGSDLTIAALPVEEKEASRMGLLKIDVNGHVLTFTEKPTDPALLRSYRMPQEHLTLHPLCDPTLPYCLASMGIYVFKKEALLRLVRHEGDDFGKDLIPLSVQQGNVSAYVYRGYWEDIGTIHSYYTANLALLKQQHCLNTYDDAHPIFAHPHNLPTPLIKQAHIHHSLISQGSIIESAEISNSIIGLNLHIEPGSVIRDSILLGSLGAHLAPHRIGHHCHIEKAILDEYVELCSHVTLSNKQGLQTFDGQGVYIRDGIIIVASGTKLPSGFTL